MTSQPKIWPIEPLQRLVERHNKPLATIARENGADDLLADRLSNYYNVGIKEGFITLKTMDSICIDGLGIHPIQAYGMAYFDPEYDGARPMKPCRTCGGPKEAGDNALCHGCKVKRALCACGCGERKVEGARYTKLRYAPTCKNGRFRKRKDSPRQEAA